MAQDRPYILGLTGGIACGKSTVAKHLEELGAAHVDADAISHQLTARGGAALEAIRETFGDGVFTAEGDLDRRVLGDVVFHDPNQRRALEGILHPMVQHEMLRLADEAGRNGKQVCVFNGPLLYETAMDALCDEVWVVTLPEDKQIIRLMNRDSLTREDAAARIASQMPLAEKEARAQFVLTTDRPEPDTRREAERKFRDLLRTLSRRKEG